jgi:hypothetical protein
MDEMYGVNMKQIKTLLRCSTAVVAIALSAICSAALIVPEVGSRVSVAYLDFELNDPAAQIQTYYSSLGVTLGSNATVQSGPGQNSGLFVPAGGSVILNAGSSLSGFSTFFASSTPWSFEMFELPLGLGDSYPPTPVVASGVGDTSLPCFGNPALSYCEWGVLGVSSGYLFQSIVFNAGNAPLYIDNLDLQLNLPVPSPAPLSLALLALLAVAFFRSRTGKSHNSAVGLC